MMALVAFVCGGVSSILAILIFALSSGEDVGQYEFRRAMENRRLRQKLRECGCEPQKKKA